MRISHAKRVRQEAVMSNSRYYLVGENDVWMVQANDTETGQHESSSRVPTLAITAAQRLAMRGEFAHVCVLDDYGRLRCKWSYHPNCLRRLSLPHRIEDLRIIQVVENKEYSLSD
jgi:hypothetical protein